jgi:hypothetical protein
LRNY